MPTSASTKAHNAKRGSAERAYMTAHSAAMADGLGGDAAHEFGVAAQMAKQVELGMRTQAEADEAVANDKAYSAELKARGL
jgi:hypothetical protein